MFQKPKRKVERVFIHCSDSDYDQHDDISVIKSWHTDPKPKGRGWSDVGYHYFIKRNGQIQKGRPLERTPAAQLRNNQGTIAICVHGKTKSKFTDRQKISLKNLCLEIQEVYHGKVTFHGHKEVAARSCPVLDYKKILKLDKYGNITLPTIAFKPIPEIKIVKKPQRSFWAKVRTWFKFD